jgi:nucleotide-binding universal stress UspA family protein
MTLSVPNNGDTEMIVPDIQKILYATDLSENSRHAFAYAAGIANRYGAGVTVLYVIEEWSRYTTDLISVFAGDEEWENIRKRKKQEVIDIIKKRIKNFCSLASGELPECPFITEKTLVKVGLPSNVIIEEAHSGEYQMVVMGTHGHSNLFDSMIGSTARRVLRRCKTPVLTVRLPD